MAVRAPDVRPDLEWLHAPEGTRLSDFRGRLLLLDFWTYGCINCQHLAPELHVVERLFSDTLAVVGVHSGKFIAERVTENIARACERMGIIHPVVNDRHFRTWREYAIRAWPTLVLVSPDGYVVDTHQGEIRAGPLAARVERALSASEGKGTLRPGTRVPGRHPPPVSPAAGLLRFPSAVLVVGPDRLFVSDAGHHRVLELALAPCRQRARVSRVIGTGRPGRDDGNVGTATFRAPRGLALHEGALYIADTGNHLLRRVDLASGRVETVAGTGEPALARVERGAAREVPLRSPWGLAWDDGSLVISVAGQHQLWRFLPGTGELVRWAGSGAEGLHDATLPMAAFAQPSGLATSDRLYVADAESSAIRGVTGEGTETLVGTGLFDFGDRDGAGDEVRMQHAQGIAWGEGALWIADSYNHRVRRLDPASRRVQSWAGSGAPGRVDGEEEARFWEPGDIAVLDGLAFVTDTNNHALRGVDLSSRRVFTVEIDHEGE